MNKIKIKEYLSPESYKLITSAAKTAEEMGYSLFLVGGPVRDILLNKAGNLKDIDLALEGDTKSFVKVFQEKISYKKLITHEKFNTASFEINSKLHMDIAMCRTEIYPQPAMLPVIEKSDISDDLGRRDFSINAMAIRLTGKNKGELLDPFEGQKDLSNRIISVLHQNSFIDDPTRLYRAIRYQTRLGFNFDIATFRLFLRGKINNSLLTPERIRYELECMLKEPDFKNVLSMANKFELFDMLGFDDTGIEYLNKRKSCDFETGLSALCANMDKDNISRLHEKLNLSKSTSKLAEEVNAIMHLKTSRIPSRIYEALSGYSVKAIGISSQLASGELKRMLNFYSGKISKIKPLISSNDLKKAGIRQSAKFGKMLADLYMLQLDGKISDKAEALGKIRDLK